MTEIHERVLIDINDGIAAITLKWLEALNAVDTVIDVKRERSWRRNFDR
jgi:hypothetical protein